MSQKTAVPFVLAMLFAFTVVVPMAAQAETEDTTAVVTSAVTTSENTTASVGTGKMTMEQRIALWKEKLAAKRGATTPATTASKGTRALGTALKSVDASCIVELVDDREVAIQKAWETFNTSVSDALKARHTALVDAWGGADSANRASEIKAAMKNWHEAHKSIFTALKTARKAAWATFKVDAKSECKVTVPTDEKLSSDGTGTVAL